VLVTALENIFIRRGVLEGVAEREREKTRGKSGVERKET